MPSRLRPHTPDAIQPPTPTPDRIAGVPTATPARHLPPARDPLPTEPGLVTDALAHSLGLMEDYLAHRGGGGRGKESDKVRTERTSVAKHCFWLATGRLPAKGGRGQLLLHADAAVPGWVPLIPEDVDAATVIDYRDHLYTADMAEATRYRESIQLGHFYKWLTGTDEHPVALATGAVRHRTPPRDTSSRQDGFYTADASRRLLEASRRRVAEAREHRHHESVTAAIQTQEWLSAEVDHVIAWLLWGTGADAAAICVLHRDDLDLDAGTITWRSDDSVLVQPIPPPLVAVLVGYLRDVWPRLRIRDGRLLLNPRAQRRHGKSYRPREVQKLTKRLAEDADLGHLPGRHTPTRWAKTYAKRILEAPAGSLITLMRLEGRSCWAGLERTYGTTSPGTSGVNIDAVYPPESAVRVQLPEARPAA